MNSKALLDVNQNSELIKQRKEQTNRFKEVQGSKFLTSNSVHNFLEQQHEHCEYGLLISTTTFSYMAQLVCQATVSFLLQQIKLTR